jgi:hypothetical protein
VASGIEASREDDMTTRDVAELLACYRPDGSGEPYSLSTVRRMVNWANPRILPARWDHRLHRYEYDETEVVAWAIERREWYEQRAARRAEAKMARDQVRLHSGGLRRQRLLARLMDRVDPALLERWRARGWM